MAVNITYGLVLIGGDAAGDFQTNTFETGAQLAPDVLGLSGGGFVSAYSNVSVSDGFIVLNFYDADHAVIGSHEFAAVSGDTDAVGQPKLTELANGNVVVVWEDDNTAGADGGPQASIYTAAGAVVAEDIDLFTPDTSTLFTELDVAALNDGNFVVSYALSGNVFYRVFDPAGAQVVGQTAVAGAVGIQADTQITRLSDGAFVVTWTDTGPVDDLIKGRIFEANGTARTGELTFSPGTGFNTQSSIAALEGGGFAVVYADNQWAEPGGAGAGISLNIVSSGGATSGAIHVNLDSAVDEHDPDVTVLANGFIAVTWTRPFGAEFDIYGRVFDQAGVPVTGELIMAGSSDDEVESAVSALLGGMFVTSWQDEVTDGDAGSIASQVSELTRTYIGDDGPNSFTGDELRDNMFGLESNDTLGGSDGDDTIDGGLEEDSIFGGTGNDVLQGGADEDFINGGPGNDRIYAHTAADPHSSPDGDQMLGDEGVDRIRGSAGVDIIDGGSGDDKLTGGGDDDGLNGSAGQDKLKGSSGDDVIEGSIGADTLNGGVGDDQLYALLVIVPDALSEGDQLNGANGDDTIHGAGGADNAVGLGGKDVMIGRGGDDTLHGGTGKDLLTGGLGADRLTGSGDKDTFRYVDVLDSANAAEDLITDLGNQDFVDLSAIDAKTGNPGDQDFTLVSAFGGNRGELVVTFHTTGAYAGFTTIQGDVDGDGAADFTIKVNGDKHVFDNFIL